MFKNLIMLNRGKYYFVYVRINLFSNISRLIDEKNVRLQDLSTINKFCSISQEKLHR
jgi:hypothetical protein